MATAEGRLIFAGADIATGWGSIDGAVETGLRAGREVAAILGNA
ncbi:MAG TPA: FAD-dependent oxidoreductase [Candidatus Limnocylindria bacterium]|nr:FAD-dependent oxidoreductase [Candidatus Limnocylindria bacterium]